VSDLSDSSSVVRLQVPTSNLADPAGSAAKPLSPYCPTDPLISGLGGRAGLTPPDLPTPWIYETPIYPGRCLSQGGSIWL
jgi:hypothetical protein